ncbi:exodeoxyribonuclease VII small subunit [Halomonas urumqiensis]|uniref:Exodeoxyribonuclease 7 small subunit n=1 Tax=Halomonas urumqiensis TaxID=1684789 RepID=A0A2N7UKJ6_9GAMM|nr:exodeoxyribonuclease VII small subunit [Halomonas urumqiensis]PMR80961.1 exodeoxyribonuclease VII small subunit [Halomonas urumqiensis]PTB02939.1 exodeoxyribonuclease VII small subunit [Halomonas urumqiensis]
MADNPSPERHPPADSSQVEPSDLDFAATVERLERLVERLESGELTLEGSLGAFEEGVRLTRDAQRRLDEAELKVRSLTEGADGGIELAPFAGPDEEDTRER